MEHNGSGDRSLFAGRVTLAWEDLKTAERRAAYDAQQQAGAQDTTWPQQVRNAQPHVKQEGVGRPVRRQAWAR